MDHRYVNPSRTAWDCRFIVFAQAPITPEPGKSTLHDPSLRQDHEALDAKWPQHSGQDPTTSRLDPVSDGRICAIGPDNLQARQLVSDLRQQGSGRVAVLHVGGRDEYGPDQAQRVDEQVPLAARAFFAAS